MATSAFRRLRKNASLRNSFSETQLKVSDFILPYFVVEGNNVQKPIASMPGVSHFSVDTLLKDVEEAFRQDIRSILLFGLAEFKDVMATGAYRKDGTTQKALRAIKKEFHDIVVYTDVCMCAFTTHGHCGIIKSGRAEERGPVTGRETVTTTLKPSRASLIDHEVSAKVLAKIALSHAEAGADFVAPSAKMDNQVNIIRKTLDENGFKDTGILSYSAKFASAFYGPFRDALDSSPQFGDRKTYQMDFRNAEEALREIEQDIEQGADIVMVKPALSYLDIISRAKETFQFPLAAYNVSGEYSMVKQTSDGNPGMERELALEILYSIKRAGADLIISYFGKNIKSWLE